MNPGESHLEQHLQRDIDALRQRVLDLGHRAGQAVHRAAQALLQSQPTEAEAVILRDPALDRLETEVERAGLGLIIRHRPAARTLRLAYASIRIAHQLERIGDSAESIARQTLQILRLDPRPSLPAFEAQTKLALDMLDRALTAYETEDEALARSSIPIEAAADQLRDQMREELLQRQARNELSGSALNLLLTVARRLERVTDQARGVCEEILFVCTGQPARELHEGPVRVLFVDDTHACLGHLAEALGRQLAPHGFQFTSAGLQPVPPLPALRDFLQQRGIDTSCLVSRSLGQVPPPEEHDLVIALTPRAQQSFPMSARSLCLFWPLEDPAAFSQPGPTLELAWQSLEHRLRPLLDAVLRD